MGLLKRCTRCDTVKLSTEFYRGVGYCNPCAKAYRLEWSRKNREYVNECNRARHSKNPGRRAEGKRVYYQKNREVLREKHHVYYLENRARLLTKSREWRAANPGKVRDACRAYAAANQEKVRKKTHAWAVSNPGRGREKVAKRKAAKLKRTPAWADLDAIRAIYESRTDGYHVDHVIPLQGKAVSGLHVAVNLQHLTARDNHEKNASYEPQWEILRPDLLA